jgi:hypothetical protein
MNEELTKEALERAFRLLSGRLDLMEAEAVRLVVCGGSALIATGLRPRTTHDADIVALMNGAGELVSPAPLPPFLLEAAAQVARDLALGPRWLNNGPSSDEGGLFQMGLPDGFVARLSERVFGPRLTVYFIGRLDQIHFKLYAAADQRDPTHLDDLQALKPTDDELETAARWAMTHDVSEGFRWLLQELLKEMGHESVAQNI